MIFRTELQAIDPADGELKTFRGPNVEAIGISDAYFVLERLGIKYCTVLGAILTDGNNNLERLKIEN